MKRPAFTLIELLVVIAVIAVLAAILFPVFAQARERARLAGCLSNLKQIGAAMMMYVQEYDETYPGPGNLAFWAPGPEGGWDSLPTRPDGAPLSLALRLQPYVKNAAVFLCPSNPTGRDLLALKQGKPEGWDTRVMRLSYDWLLSLSTAGGPQPCCQPMMMAQISRPSLLQMAYDWGPPLDRLSPEEARRTICFADGHAKLTRYGTAWEPPATNPWGWNANNPRSPVDLEKACSPSCAVEAARN
jgi:prepilin-type N-terminal cleavage/methylation domain-containing protein